MKGRVRDMMLRDRLVRDDLSRAAAGTDSPRIAQIRGRDKDLSALRAQWTGDIENVYRVLVGPTVEVVCLGIDSVDKEVEGTYADMSELPAWMQERVAVLSMIKVNPPQTKIEGIGMRVDESVYWVIKGERPRSS
jgi:hypothetical protein